MKNLIIICVSRLTVLRTYVSTRVNVCVCVCVCNRLFGIWSGSARAVSKNQSRASDCNGDNTTFARPFLVYGPWAVVATCVAPMIPPVTGNRAKTLWCTIRCARGGCQRGAIVPPPPPPHQVIVP